jgi:hypothetical protein
VYSDLANTHKNARIGESRLIKIQVMDHGLQNKDANYDVPYIRRRFLLWISDAYKNTQGPCSRIQPHNNNAVPFPQGELLRSGHQETR